MKLRVRAASGSSGELDVESQKELTRLWQLGIITGDDLVLREGTESWTRAADLPWLSPTIATQKQDNRIFWVIVVFLCASLVFVLYARGKTSVVADKVVGPPAAKAK
jgi:hypothetical protein